LLGCCEFFSLALATPENEGQKTNTKQ